MKQLLIYLNFIRLVKAVVVLKNQFFNVHVHSQPGKQANT